MAFSKRARSRKCPDCGFVQAHGHPQCRGCGLVFDAVAAGERGAKPANRDWKRRLLTGPDSPSVANVLGYGALTAALIYYGIAYVAMPIERSQTPASFVQQTIELANLVFHEAGHVLFMFFGDLLHSLGGSLTQVLIPAICLAAFLRRGDSIGAAFATWWTGQSMIDLAPYVDDARAQQLILLGGVTGRDVPGYHDWNVILGRLGLLSLDHGLARLLHVAGSLLILAAIAWSAALLWGCAGRWRSAPLGAR